MMVDRGVNMKTVKVYDNYKILKVFYKYVVDIGDKVIGVVPCLGSTYLLICLLVCWNDG